MAQLRIILRDYVPLLVALAALGASFTCLRVALKAWSDAVKLDKERRSTAEVLLAPLARNLAPRTDIEIRALKLRLMRGGIRGDDAIKRFNYIRAIVFVSASGLALATFLFDFDFVMCMFTTCLIMYVAIKIPDIWLNQQVSIRQERMARALPNVIDLMVLCLDVGLSVEAAFERVTNEMQTVEPLMAEEARLMVNEMGAGIIFPNALKRMADRVGLEELTIMSRLISQANALGASITQALREYSEASFSKRMLALEEHAGRISAWLVMPLTVCMLPASLLALAGPAVVMINKVMGH